VTSGNPQKLFRTDVAVSFGPTHSIRPPTSRSHLHNLLADIVAGGTVIRYDNSHGQHERDTAEGLDEDYEFPGYDAVQRRGFPTAGGIFID